MLPKSKMGKNSINNSFPSDSKSVAGHRLPQDIIEEILLDLPVESLVRFKSVSKPWRKFITSPRFIESHFSKSLSDFKHQLLFRTPDSGMKHCSLSDALHFHNPSAIVSDIEFPFLNHKGSVKILGIINGLLCFSADLHDLYICNPALKQLKRLPSYSPGPLELGIVHGFGYDKSNDDYKVVKLSQGPKVMVYSLRSDSWKTIEGFEGWFCLFDGTYANGKIFWTSPGPLSKIMGCSEWRIVSFDMASNKFEEVQRPSYETPTFSGVFDLLGDSLSILSRHKERAELWVMDENVHDENPWYRLFSLPYDYCIRDLRPKFYPLKKVVCILGGNEIVLEDTLGLKVYCTKTKAYRNIQLGGSYKDFFLYVESFVPCNVGRHYC